MREGEEEERGERREKYHFPFSTVRPKGSGGDEGEEGKRTVTMSFNSETQGLRR